MLNQKNMTYLALVGYTIPDFCVCLNCVKNMLEVSEVEWQTFRLRDESTGHLSDISSAPKSNAEDI